TWHPSGGRLAAEATSPATFRVFVWDASTGRELYSVPGSYPAWSPDGSALACVSDYGMTAAYSIRVWDSVAGRPLSSLRGHDRDILRLAWGPNGRLLSADSRGMVKVWDPRLSPETALAVSPLESVERVSWQPGGRLLLTVGKKRSDTPRGGPEAMVVRV